MQTDFIITFFSLFFSFVRQKTDLPPSPLPFNSLPDVNIYVQICPSNKGKRGNGCFYRSNPHSS